MMHLPVVSVDEVREPLDLFVCERLNNAKLSGTACVKRQAQAHGPRERNKQYPDLSMCTSCGPGRMLAERLAGKVKIEISERPARKSAKVAEISEPDEAEETAENAGAKEPRKKARRVDKDRVPVWHMEAMTGLGEGLPLCCSSKEGDKVTDVEDKVTCGSCRMGMATKKQKAAQAIASRPTLPSPAPIVPKLPVVQQNQVSLVPGVKIPESPVTVPKLPPLPTKPSFAITSDLLEPKPATAVFVGPSLSVPSMDAVTSLIEKTVEEAKAAAMDIDEVLEKIDTGPPLAPGEPGFMPPVSKAEGSELVHDVGAWVTWGAEIQDALRAQREKLETCERLFYDGLKALLAGEHQREAGSDSLSLEDAKDRILKMLRRRKSTMSLDEIVAETRYSKAKVLHALKTLAKEKVTVEVGETWSLAEWFKK